MQLDENTDVSQCTLRTPWNAKYQQTINFFATTKAGCCNFFACNCVAFATQRLWVVCLWSTRQLVNQQLVFVLFCYDICVCQSKLVQCENRRCKIRVSVNCYYLRLLISFILHQKKKRLQEVLHTGDVFNLIFCFVKYHIDWKNKLGRLCTDGAPVMLGPTYDFASFVKKGVPNVTITHCFVHQHA